MILKLSRLTTCMFLLLGLISQDITAQSSSASSDSKTLFGEIAHMDSLLFEAYNTQNLEKFMTLLTEDVEFYHDKGGLMSYQTILDNSKKLFDRYRKANTPIRRDLVNGSLEVYPINNYGAIQIGLHTFCHLENGKNDCGTFKFVHVWKKKDGQWQLSRILSYDH